MAPPPGPYSGASALAVVARASAFSFGLVYGSVKFKILKSGVDDPGHGNGIVTLLYRGRFMDNDKALSERIPSFDAHTWRAQIDHWKRNSYTDQSSSLP
ncbi:unnamed protein product [Dovyalis caffra]|uniref:Uncharacterized protein n=1 Tax=Dovyalis caffra TaxID=77055 RepID=A0AAV1S5Z0_9ROSI|nr:unnamed protein product [Dovyalis caffra]